MRAMFGPADQFSLSINIYINITCVMAMGTSVATGKPGGDVRKTFKLRNDLIPQHPEEERGLSHGSALCII